MADEVRNSAQPAPENTKRINLRWPLALAVAFLVVVPLSYHDAFDRMTWWLESVPALIALPMLLWTWRRYPLSNLLYTFIFIHGLILILGGHYTYARVPLGDWASHIFGWSRNNYDKLGHFAQGFVPALLTREILIRFSPFRVAPRSWFVPILAIAAPLAFSAFYEIIEWQVALATGAAAEEFLGTQGDPWDTQSDMLMALIGALVAVTLFPRAHDRSIAKLRRE